MELSEYYRASFPLAWLLDTFCGPRLPFTELMLVRSTHRVRETFDSDAALMKELLRWPPTSVHIGPRMAMPSAYPDADNRRCFRHLVIDVDLTDYDDLRRCCKGKRVCNTCWKGIGIPVARIVAHGLCKMGARKVMCVFSGGRGVHVWVCDTVLTACLTEGDLQRVCNVITGSSQFANTSTQANGNDASFTSLKNFEEIGCTLYQYADNAIARQKTLPENFVLSPTVVRMDTDASVRMHHTVKLPYSPHDTTHCISVPFDPWKSPDLSDVHIRLDDPRAKNIFIHFPPVFVDTVYSLDEMIV